MDKYEQIKLINWGFNLIANKISKLEQKVISASKINITRKELHYIFWIDYCKGQKILDIQKSIGVTKATFSNQVKLLVHKNFLIVTRDEKDKRVKYANLTEEGHRALELYKEVRQINLKKYGNILTDEEIQQIISIGRKIIEEINQE